ANPDAAWPSAWLTAFRSNCLDPDQSAAATRPTRGETGPLTNSPPCDDCRRVSIGGATLVEDAATKPGPAPDASIMRVHDEPGRCGCSDTAKPDASRPKGVKPVATSTRFQKLTGGNRNGVPPFGIVTFTSPTKNCVCSHECRKAPSRASRPAFRPPP